MLSLNDYPSFCGPIACPDLLGELIERKRNWEDSCPASVRESWVLFHVACINIVWAWDDSVHDKALMKRDFMLALYEQAYGLGERTA